MVADRVFRLGLGPGLQPRSGVGVRIGASGNGVGVGVREGEGEREGWSRPHQATQTPALSHPHSHPHPVRVVWSRAPFLSGKVVKWPTKQQWSLGRRTRRLLVLRGDRGDLSYYSSRATLGVDCLTPVLVDKNKRAGAGAGAERGRASTVVAGPPLETPSSPIVVKGRKSASPTQPTATGSATGTATGKATATGTGTGASTGTTP